MLVAAEGAGGGATVGAGVGAGVGARVAPDEMVKSNVPAEPDASVAPVKTDVVPHVHAIEPLCQPSPYESFMLST